MICFILLLFAVLCLVIALIAFAICIGAAVIVALLESVTKSITNLTHGHVIVGALYVIPAALFASGLAQLLKLAYSFVTTVVLRS